MLMNIMFLMNINYSINNEYYFIVFGMVGK